MNLKLLILFVGGLLLSGYALSRKKPLETFFWIGILLFWIRSLDIYSFGVLNISLVLFTFLTIANPRILLKSSTFKEWSSYLVTLLIGFIVALLRSDDPWFLGMPLSRSFNWILKFLAVFVISVNIKHYVNSEGKLLNLKYAFLFSSFVFSITATLAYFGFYDGVIIYGAASFAGEQDFSRDIVYSQIYGISPSNLCFGVSSISLVFLPEVSWKFWQKSAFILLVSFAVLISLKRLAILSWLLSTIYFLWKDGHTKRRTWIILVPLIIYIFNTDAYDLVVRRFGSVFETIYDTGTLDSSSLIRLGRNQIAIDSFLSNPIFGRGAGCLTFVHNGFLEILANLGIIGFTLFMPFLKVLNQPSKTFLDNAWAVALVIYALTLVIFEAAINRVEIMYFWGLFYGGYLVNKSINKRTLRSK